MALLTKVKTRMAIHAHRKVRGLLDGEYASVQTGRSMDFNDLRNYVAGDDVKDLDWKASARKGELLIKRYTADRKHHVMLCVSTGRSMAAAADPQTRKVDLAILLAGIMGWLAVRHGDLVSLVSGDSAGHHAYRPAGTEVHLERLLGRVQEQVTASTASSDLGALLDHTVRSVRRRTIMVVIADDLPLGAEDEQRLRRLRAQHEILFVSLGDLDPTDPAIAGRGVHDVDSGQILPRFVRDDPTLRAELAALRSDQQAIRRKRLERLGIASEHVDSEAGVVPAVFRLLERHRHASR